MFFLNLKKSGWLKNYLLYRLKFPFLQNKIFFEQGGRNSLYKNFDNYLYYVTKENGIIFGCPIITPSIKKLACKLKFPPKKGEAVMLFLETLFSIALLENSILLGNKNKLDNNSYERIFLKIIFLVINYHLPSIFYRIPKNIELRELLKNNETMERCLKKLEFIFLESITLKGYSSLGNRQNNFAFLNLYFFLLWARKNSKNIIYPPDSFHKMDSKIREEIIIMFAALIRSDSIIDNTESLVLENFIKQTYLPEKKQSELLFLIEKPFIKEKIEFNSKSLIIKKYIVEQLILLSLVNNQKAWQEKKHIQKISDYLGFSEKKLEELFFSVADFFSKHNKRLEFLKKNPNIQQFQDYMNDMTVSLVKKNLDKILNEIKETKELSELLFKSTSKKLTEKEKEKVKEQLLDIAKTIPALAIFALPGGGILFPTIIKFLPFNILPSSFEDNFDSNQKI